MTAGFQTLLEGEAWRGDRSILPLTVYLFAIEALYDKVKKSGPDPTTDVEIFSAVFRDWPSLSERILMFSYRMLKGCLEEYSGDKKAISHESMKYREPILGQLQFTIRELEFRLLNEMNRCEVESEAGYKAFPPDSVLDFIERQRCANDRRRSRDLHD